MAALVTVVASGGVLVTESTTDSGVPMTPTTGARPVTIGTGGPPVTFVGVDGTLWPGGVEPGGDAPAAPVLTWVSASDDNTPEFTLEIDDTIAEGDNFEIEIDESGGAFASPVQTVSNTITNAEDLANLITEAASSLADGAYIARARVSTAAAPTTWSNWSNTASQTIATGSRLLIETGDVLLLETGDRFLLEA